jgi:hypothetical protein
MRNLFSDWNAEEKRILDRLDSPERIQGFLDDRVQYGRDSRYRSAWAVMRDRKAHCLDGALFACAALRYHGKAPLVLDLRALPEDDDHVIAVFQSRGAWGAIAKSNFSGLRYRDPIYQTLRELVMSYFDHYFDRNGNKSLREFSEPYDLRESDDLNWLNDDSKLEELAARLDAVPHQRLITPSQANTLARADRRMQLAEKAGRE